MKSLFKITAFYILIAFLAGCSDSNIPDSYHASLSGHSLNISKNQLSFNSNGGVENITVYANNVAWRFSGLPLWLTVNPNSGSSTTSVTFTASENLSADTTRTALFYLESADAGWSFKTMVSANQQAATSYITPATTSLTFNGGGGSQTINVSSNVLWKATSSVSWAKAETATDGCTLTISVEENTSDVSRTAIVTLSSASGISSSINITQSPADVTGSTETLEFGKKGGSKSISITSEATWEAKTSDSWITVTPLSGDAGTHNLTITALENNSVAQRNGYVYVNIGSSSKLQIPIVQKGLYIEVNPNSLSFSADAESKQIDVNSNTDWKIISMPDWLSSNTQAGENSQTIVVTSNRNTSASSRNGIIKFGKEGLSLFANVDVVQEGLNLSVDNNNLQFSDKASSQDLTINTIAEWSVSCSESWVHLSKTTGIGTSVIVVSVDENTGENSRTGSIRVTAGELSHTVAVVQQGKYFNISETDKTFTSKGGTLQLSFSTNETWTASLAEDVSWLSLSSTSGNGDGVINVTASDNASMKTRENAIIISPANSAKVRVSIKQAGRYLTVDCTELNFGQGGGTSQDIAINSDGSFDVVSNESWISVKMKSSNIFNVTVPLNNGLRREGVVTINMKDLNNSENYALTIPVIQKGNGLDKDDFVDLGLPSGTKWAKYNLGAKSADELGDKYCWGETTPRKIAFWDTYKYSNGSYNSLTKYNMDSSLGIVDNLSSLQNNDDAAFIQTGGVGRMPTKEEVEELIEYCTFESQVNSKVNENDSSTWIYGMYVCKVIGPNGNSISFPIRKGVGYTTNCYYWTKDLDENSCFNAYCYKDYNYDKLVLNSAGRSSLLHVRPVLVK